MGRPNHRLDDVCTGHGCFPSRPLVGASSNVLTNGKGQARVGDPYACHGCAFCPCHGGFCAAGSGSHYTNGQPTVRQGDAVSCGGTASAHSGSVFTGS